MDYIDTILKEAVETPELKILIFTRSFKQLLNTKEKLWKGLKLDDFKKRFSDLKIASTKSYKFIFDNCSSIQIVALNCSEKNTRGFRFDKIYFFKNDNLSPDEKIHLLLPLLACQKNNKLVTERFVEIA